MKNVLITGIPFGIFMGLFFSLVYGTGFGLVGGVASGLLFGVAISIFTKLQREKMESKDAIFEGERVLFQGPANHFKNREGRGGWLTLTPSCLAFRSHGANIQNQGVSLRVEDIAHVTRALTLGIVPNGLCIKKTNGQEEFFVVSNRQQWVKLIARQVNHGVSQE
ncbi:MAG: hypothetical protein AAF282_03620 [Cyanobacteria bacterium P01_A01_bin.15]